MDLSYVAAGETSVDKTPFKVPIHGAIINLTSDDESVEDNPPHVSPTEAHNADGDGENELELSESLSWLEDVLEEVSDEQFNSEEDACSLEEARAYRSLLRSVGPEELMKQMVYNGTISAKKLLTAFGIRPPLFFEDSPNEEVYLVLLRLAFQRELRRRLKLPQYNTIDDVVKLLENSQNIIVVTGAGISTSLGIPDFRSKEIGLYSKLEHLGLSDPQEVFEINLFRQDPSIFYSIAGEILPSTERFSPTHAFIRLLQDKGKLLTNYTQNIDNIEAKAGILPEKLIQCHGSFVTASCQKCMAQVPGETIFPELKAGDIPRCKRCIDAIRLKQVSTGMKRKRSKNGTEKKRQRRFEGSPDSSSDEDDNIPEAGVMKPDITFFGEALSDAFSTRLFIHDKDLVDLVIVIGTSLKVSPVADIVPILPANIPQMYISREPVSHVEFDIDMLGDCDVVVAELCRRAGWDLQHDMVPQDQKVDIYSHETFKSRYSFKEQKDGDEDEDEDRDDDDEDRDDDDDDDGDHDEDHNEDHDHDEDMDGNVDEDEVH